MKNVLDIDEGLARDLGEFWPEDEGIDVRVGMRLTDNGNTVSFTWPTGSRPQDYAALVVPIDRLKRLLEVA